MAYHQAPDLPALLRKYRACRYVIIGLELTDHSVPLAAFDFRPLRTGLVLVAGAERSGIQPAVLAVLDAAVHVPMYGRNSSLNVATALAIGLYEVTRQWEMQL